MNDARGWLSASEPVVPVPLAGAALAAYPVKAPKRDLAIVSPVSCNDRPARSEWCEQDLRGPGLADQLDFAPLQRPFDRAARYHLTGRALLARQQVLGWRRPSEPPHPRNHYILARGARVAH